MIYLIAGMAKSGKTFVAKQMTRQTGYGYFSTDYLVMSLYRAAPEAGVSPNDHDVIVAKAMEPFLHAMIQAMVENKVPYIFEGIHFVPEFVARLQKDFPGAVRAVFLGFKNATVEEKIADMQRHSGDVENDWMGDWTPAERAETVHYLILGSGRLEKAAEKYGYPYFEITEITRQADEIMATLLH